MWAVLASVLLAAARPGLADNLTPPALPPDARRPNIVYILCDDLGYGDVAALNPASKVPTPNMDAVARGGMAFTDAHSNSAVCTPTRYGVLTGRYAFRTRLTKGVLNGYGEPLIEPGRLTVPALLRAQGYHTACVGKWHLGLGWQTTDGRTPTDKNVGYARPVTGGPNAVGFDWSYIIPASLDMDPYVYLEDGRVTEQPTGRTENSPRPFYWRGGPVAPSFKHETVLLTLTEKAERYIDERAKAAGRPGAAAAAGASRPFFLYLPLNSPHTPHVPRAEFRGKSAAGNYGDFLLETDWAVGRVLEALHRNGIERDTMVVLTSDNGSHTQPIEPELAGHAGNGIFRGQKSDAWEGGHRVPMLVRWPAVVRPGSRCDQTVCLTDLLATAAEVTGAKVPAGAGEDSASMLPLLAGRTDQPTREATVHHSIDGAFAVRRGKWKLILAQGSGGWSMKEPAARDLPGVQLYDMDADPGETKNLQAEHPAVAAELRALLARYVADGRSVPAR